MAEKRTLKLLATVYNQPEGDLPDNPAVPVKMVRRTKGEVFEARDKAEYDRLIEIGAALDPDEAQKQEKAQLDARQAALDAEIAQVQDRKKALAAEAKSSQAKG